MPTVPENAPSSTTTPIGVDCEPDDAWKEQLRRRIQDDLQLMIVDANEDLATELGKAPDTPEARMRLEADYKQAIQTIYGLASEQYRLELDRERNQRRWTAGIPMTPGWSQYFRQEHQNIMKSIKQSNQTDNLVRTATESPTEERRSAIPKPSNEPLVLAPTPVLLPVPPSSSVRPSEEHEKSSPQNVRQGSNVRSTLSGDHNDPGSFRPRARISSIDRPSQPSHVSPNRRSSGSIHSSEHLARSPLRAPPEIRKPAISPAEDALPAKHYNLGRRKSATSMRSTGFAASIRPSITETIPERADDDESDSDESSIEVNYYERAQETTEQGRIWISADKSHEKEKQSHLRGNSRSPVDAGLRSDNLGSSGLKSDDRHRPIDSPGKSSPRKHRLQQLLSPDPRSVPARSSYEDESDYGSQYSTPHRPHGPKSSSYYPQRESRPISRQVSFTRQPHVDLDDDKDERERDRGRRRDRERHLDREYDRREEDARKKGEEIWRMEEEMKRKEEDARQKEEEIWRREEEMKRKEENTRKKEEEIWRMEEEVKRNEEDARKKEEDIRRMEEEAKRKVEDARKKEEEIWRNEEEVKRKEENARKKEEDIWRMEEELKRKEEDVRKKEEEIWGMAEEVKRKEEDARKKEEEIWRMEEEVKRKEDDARKKEEEIWRMEEEVKRKEEDARKKEEKIWRMEEVVKRKEEDGRKKEAEIWRMEEEMKRKEEDAARKARKGKKMEAVVMKKEADAKRKEKEVRIKEEDAKRKDEAARLEVEEARRRAEELSRKEEVAKQREEDLKKMEEEALKKDIEMKERENILRQREEDSELIRREADNFRREEDAKKNERAKEDAFNGSFTAANNPRYDRVWVVFNDTNINTTSSTSSSFE